MANPSGETGGADVYIRRARRSFAVSMLILFAGLIAVAVALVYRLNRDAEPAAALSEIVLPAGAETLSAVMADGNVTVTYRLGEETIIRIVDAATGETENEIRVTD